MGVCNCSMFCCMLLYVHFSIAIILTGKRELIALLNLSSWCLVMVERLFITVPRGCLQFVIVVFPDHTHLLFLGPGGKGVVEAKEDIKHLTKVDCFAKWSFLLYINCIKYILYRDRPFVYGLFHIRVTEITSTVDDHNKFAFKT